MLPWLMSSFSIDVNLHHSYCSGLWKSREVNENLEDLNLWNERAGCRLKGAIGNMFPERDI